ncbi:DUF742 domain-containing protein [Pseudonocardia sp.]|uniref:DUF742 domain-containing protein n=1 Tax=Pseudonocardia sp. TaxID=60912 RepID=UPI0026044E96|nr:DUF742 domain-containing protein [Pseudonocardia sp.]
MPSPDGSAPEIGLTGARFGGARRKRRAAMDPVPDPAPSPVPSPVSVPPPPASGADVVDDPIGLTGARFGGAARRRRPESAPPEAAAPAPGRRGAPERPVEPPRELWPALPPPVREPETGPTAEPSPYTLVRPYVLTGGRTRAGVEFAVEALLTARPGPPRAGEPVEHTRIRGLCEQPRSVAEVAALAGFPLGVVRVLLADMHAAGAVAVHRTADAGGPDLALMERVLAGLRRL